MRYSIYKTLLVSGFIFTALLAKSQPVFQWVKQIGSPEGESGTAIATDGPGNVYITGFYTDTLDLDPGPGTFTVAGYANYLKPFVCKLDAGGNSIWEKSISSPNASSVTCSPIAMALDNAANVFILGRFNGTNDFDPGAGVFNLTPSSSTGSSIFVLKLDASGNFGWVKQLDVSATDIKADATGNLYITGSFAGTTDFDPGTAVFNLTSFGTPSSDIFILKLNTSGDFIWVKQMGGNLADNAYALATDAQGNIYSTGAFTGASDFDPGPGTFNLNAAANNLFVSKLDAAGNFVWATQINANCQPSSITLDPAGNVYATGVFVSTGDFDPGPGTQVLTSAGNTDAFILKLNAAGNFIWAKQLGGWGPDQSNAVKADASGIYTAGYFTSQADFDPGTGSFSLTASSYDIFISKLDTAGNFLFAKGIGGPGNDIPNGMTIDAAYNIYTTGGFAQTVDFDAGSSTYNLTSSGLFDVFIYKMSQNDLVDIKENFNAADALAFPNPTAGRLNLAVSNTENQNIEIYSSLGELVCRQTKVRGLVNLDITGYPSGLYFVKIISNTQTVSLHKIVKQ